jgi:hypothetical protein
MTVAALLLKQLSQKDHIDLFTEILQDPPPDIQSILQQTLVHFGQTHMAQDIQDLNSIFAWVLYGRETLTLAQLNAAIGLESDHGEFLDIRDKIGREFSAYFSIVDLRHKDPLEQAGNPQGDADANKEGPQTSTPDTSLKGVAEGQANDDPATEFDDDLDVPTVKVAHASVAKFFRSVGSCSVEEKNICIGMNRKEAHLRLAKTCLRVICSIAEPSRSWKSMGTTDKLLSYAARYFPDHLAEAKSVATLEGKLEIFRYLVRCFRDEDVISRWVRETALWPDWFDMDKALGTVWSWLSDESVLKELKDEEKAWVTESASSISERVMKPIAIWFAKKWLQDPAIEVHDQSLYYFAYLSGFIKLVSPVISPLPVLMFGLV